MIQLQDLFHVINEMQSNRYGLSSINLYPILMDYFWFPMYVFMAFNLFGSYSNLLFIF